jgi:hypothetical protein
VKTNSTTLVNSLFWLFNFVHPTLHYSRSQFNVPWLFHI